MWKEGNEGDTEVQFQKDTMVIFASSENEDIWQGIRTTDIFFSIVNNKLFEVHKYFI